MMLPWLVTVPNNVTYIRNVISDIRLSNRKKGPNKKVEDVGEKVFDYVSMKISSIPIQIVVSLLIRIMFYRYFYTSLCKAWGDNDESV